MKNARKCQDAIFCCYNQNIFPVGIRDSKWLADDVPCLNAGLDLIQMDLVSRFTQKNDHIQGEDILLNHRLRICDAFRVT